MTSKSASKTDGECPECEGTLYEDDYDTFCAECGLVLSSHSPQDDRLPPWRYHHESPSEYQNSGRTRCIGGFPHAYDWVSSDEIDGAVSDLDPDSFYR